MRELTTVENNVANIAWSGDLYWWLECIVTYDDDKLTQEENLIKKGLELYRFINSIIEGEDLELSSEEFDAVAITIYNEFVQDEKEGII